MRIQFVGNDHVRVVTTADLGIEGPTRGWQWAPNGVIDFEGVGIDDAILEKLVEEHPGQFAIVDADNQIITGELDTPAAQDITVSDPAPTPEQQASAAGAPAPADVPAPAQTASQEAGTVTPQTSTSTGTQPYANAADAVNLDEDETPHIG